MPGGSDRSPQPSGDANPCTRGLRAGSIYKDPPVSALGPGCGAGLASDGIAGKRWGQEVTPPGLCGGDNTGLTGDEGKWKRRVGQVEILNNTGVLFTVLFL